MLGEAGRLQAEMGSLTPEIAIVGAGLSGLACARKLARSGVRFTIYESADAVGGRVRTDVLDGFRLDRGFQVFLPGYPAARQILDYEALVFRPFFRGADVFHAGRSKRRGLNRG